MQSLLVAFAVLPTHVSIIRDEGRDAHKNIYACIMDQGYQFYVHFFPPLPPNQPYSGVAAPKTGLQWQQPFLELVLACMHAQSTTHEELLGPLKTQISTFLAAFEKVCTTKKTSSGVWLGQRWSLL